MKISVWHFLKRIKKNFIFLKIFFRKDIHTRLLNPLSIVLMSYKILLPLYSQQLSLESLLKVGNILKFQI